MVSITVPLTVREKLDIHRVTLARKLAIGTLARHILLRHLKIKEAKRKGSGNRPTEYVENSLKIR